MLNTQDVNTVFVWVHSVCVGTLCLCGKTVFVWEHSVCEGTQCLCGNTVFVCKQCLCVQATRQCVHNFVFTVIIN